MTRGQIQLKAAFKWYTSFLHASSHKALSRKEINTISKSICLVAPYTHFSGYRTFSMRLRKAWNISTTAHHNVIEFELAVNLAINCVIAIMLLHFQNMHLCGIRSYEIETIFFETTFIDNCACLCKK